MTFNSIKDYHRRDTGRYPRPQDPSFNSIKDYHARRFTREEGTDLSFNSIKDYQNLYMDSNQEGS